MSQFSYIDLFSGCGGLSDGFEATGQFCGLAHIEIDRIAASTLKNRIESAYGRDGNHEVGIFDIQRTEELIHGWKDDPIFGSDSGLRSRLPRNKRLDVLIGGPPCQAYSIAGRVRDEHGMKYDYRNYLFESYVKVLEWAQPKAFVFENVVGILSAAPGGVPITERIHTAFARAGYHVLSNFRDGLFDLSRYSVPQKRNRVIIIGLRKSQYKKASVAALDGLYLRLRELGEGAEDVTARAAIGDLPKLFPKKQSKPQDRHSHTPKSTTVLNHYPRYHSPRDVETFRLLADDLAHGARRYGTIDAIKALYTQRTGKISAVHKYHVIRPDEPSNTIPAHLYKDGLRHIHWDPKQARSITVREAARLQGFADDFEFLGSMGDQYKMIGNAVPPIFAATVARSLAELL
jgi:DNA (cytosine-5)-methyltransferase 1